MPAGKHHPRRLGACQYKANLVTHAPFVINWIVTLENHRVNHEFRESVADLLATKKQHRPSDFISVAKAQQQILSHTGRKVSHSTAARWIAQNNLGYKLPGYKGQWIVDGVLFEEYLQQITKLL